MRKLWSLSIVVCLVLGFAFGALTMRVGHPVSAKEAGAAAVATETPAPRATPPRYETTRTYNGYIVHERINGVDCYTVYNAWNAPASISCLPAEPRSRAAP